MNATDTDLAVGHTSSGAEKLAKKLPKARIVQAFNTVPSEVLFSVFEKRLRKNRPSLVYCGDNAKAKRVAAKLITDVGFEPIDIGALRMARYSEPFTMIIAQQAYETRRGPALAYRFEWYKEKKR
jgi:predicted dinucleotide-binding enzyme